MTAAAPGVAALAPALERLDRLLERGVAAAELVFGPGALADPFRGLHVSRADSEALLAREPGFPLLAALDRDGRLVPGDDAPPLQALARRFGLSPFELDVVLIALAPELDLRYERLYGFLQDDVTRKRPTVDLVLNLLCESTEEKLARRDRFAPNAPLLRERVVRLVSDGRAGTPPLLAHAVELDEQIVRLLLGGASLDPRLAAFCELRPPAREAEDARSLLGPTAETLGGLVARARRSGEPVRLLLRGRPGSDRDRAAAAVAAEAGRPLLVADLERASPSEAFPELARVLVREVELLDALLYVEGLDGLSPDRRRAWERALAGSGAAVVMAGSEPWATTAHGDGTDPLGVIMLDVALPGLEARRALWAAELASRGSPVDAAELDALAGRFTLAPQSIREAARIATTLRGRRRRPTLDGLFAAARAQTGHELGTLADKIETAYEWHDIVLPENALAQLRELCSREANRHRVLDDWGFGRKLLLGRGLATLFAGPSGTGKTMAAGIVARELGLDLYRIELAAVVSKWIGETEKNIARIFDAAEHANVILFFDEAEALFGKRSEVRDSHDRYANVEISYLLQRMEAHQGLAILATNLVENLDEAFLRRLAFRVDFPFPEQAERRRIWAVVWPREIPLARDVDLDRLAREVSLAGGNIKNIALAAAFFAADEGGRVKMKHVLHAVRREYEKLGKSVSENELAGEA